jgi:hypothetical protein
VREAVEPDHGADGKTVDAVKFAGDVGFQHAAGPFMVTGSFLKTGSFETR